MNNDTVHKLKETGWSHKLKETGWSHKQKFRLDRGGHSAQQFHFSVRMNQISAEHTLTVNVQLFSV